MFLGIFSPTPTQLHSILLCICRPTHAFTTSPLPPASTTFPQNALSMQRTNQDHVVLVLHFSLDLPPCARCLPRHPVTRVQSADLLPLVVHDVRAHRPAAERSGLSRRMKKLMRRTLRMRTRMRMRHKQRMRMRLRLRLMMRKKKLRMRMRAKL